MPCATKTILAYTEYTDFLGSHSVVAHKSAEILDLRFEWNNRKSKIANRDAYFETTAFTT